MCNLIDVVTRDGVVESTVEIIQQFNDLHRTTFIRQLCESDDIREVDRRARIHLWSHTTSCLQLVRHVTILQQMDAQWKQLWKLLNTLYIIWATGRRRKNAQYDSWDGNISRFLSSIFYQIVSHERKISLSRRLNINCTTIPMSMHVPGTVSVLIGFLSFSAIWKRRHVLYIPLGD